MRELAIDERPDRFERVDRRVFERYSALGEPGTPRSGASAPPIGSRRAADSGHRETARILEAAAIALAARVLSEQDVADARTTNELLRRTRDGSLMATASQLTRTFHRRIVRACPNTHMVVLLEQQVGLDVEVSVAMSSAAIARAADEHDHLLQLIERQADARTIERFALDHVATSCSCSSPV